MQPNIERARGYVLLGIIYIHALIAFASVREPAGIAASFIQIKLLSPHVSVFFLLSGMGARHIARRQFAQVARQSGALVLVAALSHVTGFVLLAMLHGTGADLADSLKMLVKPLVLGTGYSTFVAWFFLTLAVARLATYVFYRSWRIFTIAVVVLAALILASGQLGAPANIFEWRTWPPAFLFFLIGTRMPRDLVIPLPYGLAAAAGSLVLTWFNRPGVLLEGPCLACDLTFVSQPMMGGFGSIPVFFAQEMLFFVFLVAVSRMERPFWLARPARFFGHYSAPFLLLNGWILLIVNPWVLPLLPGRDSLPLFAALLVGGAVLHFALFRLLKRPLNLMLLASFQAVERIASMTLVVGPLRLPARRWLK